MDSASQRSTTLRCNVLALDGGGVRGLSSLLILQDLMRHINAAIQHQRRGEEIQGAVGPRDVFDFVAGTSTGGLIAIMLGKLGMSLEESIQAYYDLSKSIFEKRHIRGRITHGLAPTRYSGSHLRRCIQDLIRKKKFPVTIPMVSDDNRDHIACAVICREHSHQSKYSDIKPHAVPICSVRCDQQVVCLVSEAARATSAAPTFFPVQKIDDRYFVDGGMEYNNPSFAIWVHYTEHDRVTKSKITSNMPEAASPAAHHDGLDFSRVRIVNLGTGTKPEELPPRQRDRLATFVPAFIKMSLFLKRTLTEFAVSSEQMAEAMKHIAAASLGRVKYERFSADNGVCYIKMDKYKKIQLIRELTAEYLESDATKARLKRVGEEIAMEYLSKHHHETTIESAPSNNLTVPHPDSTSSRNNLPQTPETSEAGPSAPASTNSSYEMSQKDTKIDTDPRKEAGEVRLEWATSPHVDTKEISADMVKQEIGIATESTGLAEC